MGIPPPVGKSVVLAGAQCAVRSAGMVNVPPLCFDYKTFSISTAGQLQGPAADGEGQRGAGAGQGRWGLSSS
jgi:hypothetical protein